MVEAAMYSAISPREHHTGCDDKNDHHHHSRRLTTSNAGLRQFSAGEQGKRIRIYRNGDQFFKGLWFTIRYRNYTWDTLLVDLNHHLSDSISLPQGVRYIFSIDGIQKQSVDELEHGMSYVCCSSEKFKAIDYANASQPMWSFVSSKMEPQYKGSIRATFEREANEFVQPRVIEVIRNGLRPRRVVRLLLNKKTAPSFQHVMQDITSLVKLNSGIVRKLYTLSGKRVSTLSDFFGADHIFIAFGTEKICADELQTISEDHRRITMLNGRQKRSVATRHGGMPSRNDGFHQNSQAVNLPPQLADSIKVLNLLGDGQTALVFKALFRDTSSEYYTPDALKIINRPSEEEMLKFIKTEIELLGEIKHEYIVAMRDYQLIDGSWYIRMELIEDGDLFEHLRSNRVLSEANAASCTACLCDALNYLHSRLIVHRDVKPENLLTYKCPSTGLLKLKLADFGLACRLSKEDELLYLLCGTPTYVAPEVLAEFGYSFKADCWSVGIILYIMLAGFPPFGMDEDVVLFTRILRGTFDFPSPSFDHTTHSSRLLIRLLLCTEPKTRLSASQVLDFEWVKGLGHTNPTMEEQCKHQLREAMAFGGDDFEESDTEYFYSRRASMDELSEHHQPKNDNDFNGL